MGPSGCGKTTLLNCLSGLDAIDEGEIVIEGTPLSAMSDAARTDYRARRMGFVFQFYNLLPVLTAVENVELPLLVARTAPARGAAAGAGGARAGRRRRSGRARARQAVRRRAPARDHRPRPGQRPGHRLGRRADRRSRQRERPGDRGAHAGAQPRARPQLPDRHPRHLRRPQHRPDRPHARRAGRRGATTGGVACSRGVTQLEIDVMRTSVEEAAGRFDAEVLPELRRRPGFRGAVRARDPGRLRHRHHALGGRGGRGPRRALRGRPGPLRDALPRRRPAARSTRSCSPTCRAPPRPRRRERGLRRPRGDARGRPARRARGRPRGPGGPRRPQPRPGAARRPERRPPPRPVGADRPGPDARHDDHRGLAGDRRHDEPHHPRHRDRGPGPDRRGGRRAGLVRGDGHGARVRLRADLLPRRRSTDASAAPWPDPASQTA